MATGYAVFPVLELPAIAVAAGWSHDGKRAVRGMLRLCYCHLGRHEKGSVPPELESSFLAGVPQVTASQRRPSCKKIRERSIILVPCLSEVLS